jgi:threonine/homoserine/homoserine lactone efflux protein
MCLFIGILFLIGLPLAVINGTFTGDPVFFAALWILGLIAIGYRAWQTLRPRA